MVMLLSVLVAFLGGLIYLLFAKPKYETLGLVAFGCGLLAFLIRMAPKALPLLPQ